MMNNSDMPAMPRDCAKSHISTLAEDSLGMTKREYFAGLAMQGSISRGFWGESDKSKAEEAVRAADALLKALEK